MTTPSVTVTATIAGRHVDREQLLAWEDRRITAAAKRLRVKVPTPGRVESRRESLLESKLELGPDEIVRRVGRDMERSDRMARLGNAITKRRISAQSEMQVVGGSASEFVEWFHLSVVNNDVAAMLRACPDHFVLRTNADGRQEVIQATGASPMVNRFFLEYGKSASLRTPRDREFPFEIVAEATGSDGAPIGGARLQFRDTASGFHGLLCEQFPMMTPPWMVAQQRWHCVTEFRNWAEMAFA